MATPTFILPSAPTYTEGFVNGLNVYPNPTNFVANQVPFTRAATATRTNAAGLIEIVPYNIFQYSEQFNNAAWLVAEASITPNSTTAPNGTLTADTFIGNGVSGLPHRITPGTVQGISVISGTAYTVSCYVKKNTNDFFQIYFQAGQFSANAFANFDVNNGVLGTVGSAATATITNVGGGWYRCSVTSTANSTNLSGVSFSLITSTTATRNEPNALNTSVFLWGAQFVEGTGALPYQQTETRLNRPRVDFSLGGCPNLLLEPQRTNVVLYSADLSQSIWSKTNYVLSSTTPIQGINATRITKNSVDNDVFTGIDTRNVINTVGTYAAGTKTLTYLIRKGNTDKVGFLINNVLVGALTAVSCTFDFNTQTFANVSAGLTTGFESPSTDVYKISLTIADTGTATNKAIWIAPIDNFNSTVDGGYLDFAFAQFETGSYPTTYIPTTSATVTRNSDSFTFSNVFTNNLISSAGGTWFVDFRGNIARVRDAASQFWLGDTSSTNLNNAFTFRGQATSARMSINKVVGTTTTQLLTTAADTIKVAIKWNGTTADVFVNGVKVVAATSFTTTNMEFLYGFAADVPKYINSMALYNTPISDAECIQITT